MSDSNSRRKNSLVNRYRKPRKLDSADIRFIKKILDNDCSVTCSMIENRLASERQKSVSERTVCRYISSFNYSIKRVSNVLERRNDPRNIETRYEYALDFAQLDEDKIFFLDETGLQINMRRIYGRSLRGQRANKRVPQLRSKNISVSAAICKSSLFFRDNE